MDPETIIKLGPGKFWEKKLKGVRIATNSQVLPVGLYFIWPLFKRKFFLPIHSGVSYLFGGQHHKPRRITVSRPGTKPVPSELEAQTLNHWTSREVYLSIAKKYSVSFPSSLIAQLVKRET